MFITLSAYVYFFYAQQTLNYEACKSCDGNHYLDIYSFFKNSLHEYSVHFPFNCRILIPLIASQIPLLDPELSFHFTNIFFSICAICSIYYLWTILNITNTLKFLGIFWLLFHWVGILRLNIFDVVTVDVSLYLFHTLLLIIIYKKKYSWLWLLSIVATTQKESFPSYLIFLTITAILYNTFYDKYFKLKPILLSLLLSFITKYVVIYFFPPIEEGMNSFLSVAFYIKQILLNPLLIIKWTVSIFIGFGGLFLLALKSKEKDWNPENIVLLVFAILSLGLGLIAGGDFTRITFLGFPFIMTFILLRVSDKPLLLIMISFMLSIPCFRLFSHIPPPKDYILFNHEWYPEFAQNGTVALWGIYMIICYLVISKVSKSLS